MLMEYNQADIRSLAISAHKKYKGELDKTLELPSYIADLIALAKEGDPTFHGFNKLYRNGYPRRVRIAPPVHEILASLNKINNQLSAMSLDTSLSAEELASKRKELILSVIKPVEEFDFDPYTEEMQGLWWGDCITGINCRPGLVNNDPSKPIPFTIGKTKVHTLVGGDTGQGKSVAVNSIIVPWLFEYPPWELRVYLNDMKLLEFARYGQAYRCPQIASIAATGSVTYIISVLEVFDQEMKDLYTIGSIIGSQSLAAIRDYLDMSIPRNIMVTDEFTQAYENATPREITRMDFLLQSIAKLGRAVGYHTLKTSQNFTGTMPSSTMKQFAVGVSVGAGEDVSTALIGNGGAVALTKKLGYCLVNDNRADGDITNNVEYKVSFLDEDSDEGKAKMQNMLKRVCDVGNTVADFRQLQYYNETIQTNYDNIDADYEKCRYEMKSLANSRKLLPFVNVMLGNSMRYTGKLDSMEFFIWDYSRRSNVVIHSSDNDTMLYLSEILINSLVLHNQGEDVKYRVIVDNRELYSEDIFGAMAKDLTGDFNVSGFYSEAVKRDYVLKYNLSCEGDNTTTSLINFLIFKNSKIKDTGITDALDLLMGNGITDCEEVEEMITRTLSVVTEEEEEEGPLTNPIELELSEFTCLYTLWDDSQYYLKMMDRKSSNYLQATDFPKWNIWMLSPQSNEGIFKRGGIMPEFTSLLAIGPTVGIFFTLVMDEVRGYNELLRNANHLVISHPKSELENYTQDQFITDVDIACKYVKYQGDADLNFYFKQYLKIE